MRQRKRLRRVVGLVHKWLGIGLGIPLALLGLTGSLLVFYPEIDLLLNPGQHPTRAVNARSIHWRDVVARLDALSAASGGWRIEIPADATRPITARQMRIVPGHGFAPRVVTLDPSTLTPTSDRLWGEYAVTWIYDLHYTLLAGDAGRLVVGWLGVVALILLASGIVLGWPPCGRWRLALSPRIRRGRILAVYDTHAKTGFYGWIFLVTLALTGAILALPSVFEPLLARLSPVWTAPVLTSQPTTASFTIDADAALARARAAVPNAQARWLETPDGPSGVYRVRFYSPGEPGWRFPKTFVWIDPWSGGVIVTRLPSQQSMSDLFLGWLHPLHNGEAFGLTGRIIVLLSGLLPLAMVASGLLRWQDKRSARRLARR